MRALTEETVEIEPHRWEQVGLGGAQYLIRFQGRPQIAAAVMALLSCHEHHFAVVGEGRELALSIRGVRCLEERGLIDVYQTVSRMGVE